MQIVPLVGWALDGARVTERDLCAAALGRPVWGPRGLLADLELRCGVGPLAVDPMARVFALRARADAIVARQPDVFFARSLRVDPWVTAKTLLALRDELVLAGWDGSAGAGLPRVEALAALDGAHVDGPLPPAEVDRIARVTLALTGAPYGRIALTEPIVDWPEAWRRLWARLAALGVSVEHEPGARVTEEEDDAQPSDLARIRRALRLGLPAGEALQVEGDGSFVVLNAETPDPLAEAVAALVRAEAQAHPERTIAVLRTAELGALEAALPRFGLPRLGGSRSPGVPLAGAWLPLVMALVGPAFDAEAAIDLVLMPGSGVRGSHGGRLASALQRAPGLGASWSKAIKAIRGEERGPLPESVERLLGWVRPALTGGHEPLDAARRAAFEAEIERRIKALDQVLAARVGAYRVPADARGERNPMGDLSSIDALQAARVALAAWLQALPEELAQGAAGEGASSSLDALLQTFSAVAAGALTQHEAGELERVDEPAALCTVVDTLVWWGFVDPGRPATSGFRQHEHARLEAVGVLLDPPEAVMQRQARSWRALLGRARRVVFAVPGRVAGARQAPHPLWAEIRGRLRWESDEALAAVTTTPGALLADGRLGSGRHALVLPNASLAYVVWPGARTQWRIELGARADLVPVGDKHSVSSLETLLKCPLRSVLERRGKLWQRAVGTIDAMPLFLGNLGHHVIEDLFHAGELTQDGMGATLEARIEAKIGEELTLLRAAGRRVEHDENVRQLAAAIREAVTWLDAERLTVRAVEEPIAFACGERRIEGRLDLLAEDASGSAVIVDFKWSTRKHAAALHGERAVQLATYAEHYRRDGVMPRGAFIGLRDGRVAPADGALLDRTWRRVTALLGPVEAALSAGDVHVPGVMGAPQLMDVLAAGDGMRADPTTICDYCRFDLVCGKGLSQAEAAGQGAGGDDDD